MNSCSYCKTKLDAIYLIFYNFFFNSEIIFQSSHILPCEYFLQIIFINSIQKLRNMCFRRRIEMGSQSVTSMKQQVILTIFSNSYLPIFFSIQSPSEYNIKFYTSYNFLCRLWRTNCYVFKQLFFFLKRFDESDCVITYCSDKTRSAFGQNDCSNFEYYYFSCCDVSCT